MCLRVTRRSSLLVIPVVGRDSILYDLEGTGDVKVSRRPEGTGIWRSQAAAGLFSPVLNISF